MPRHTATLAASAVAAILILASAPSEAGYVSLDTAGCVTNADGSGYCYGTKRGFRNDAHPGSRAEFYVNHEGRVMFIGELGGLWHSCWFASSTQSTMFASFAAQTNGFFVVSFNASGTCTYGYAYQGSDYGSDY